MNGAEATEIRRGFMLTREKVINNIKNQLYDYFSEEKYKKIDAKRIIDVTIDLCLDEEYADLERQLLAIVLKIKPGNDINAIYKAYTEYLIFHVANVTCKSLADAIDDSKLNKFIKKNLSVLESTSRISLIQVNSALEKYDKRQKASNNVKKAASVLGKIVSSPFVVLKKMSDFADEYEKRPDVQERRRQESIRYYCKLCGQSFKDPSQLRSLCIYRSKYEIAMEKLTGTPRTPPSYHLLYEGTPKSMYTCIYCGKQEKELDPLVTKVCTVLLMNNKSKLRIPAGGYTPSEVHDISRHVAAR